jgi:hypothetical protein
LGEGKNGEPREGILSGFISREPDEPPRESHPGAMEPIAAEWVPAPHGGAAEQHEASEHSFWPFTLAIGLLLIGIGLLSTLAIAVVGVLVMLAAVVGWLWQPWTT